MSNCSASHFTAPQAFSRETLLQNVVWKLNSQSHFNEIERRECMRLHQIIGFLAGLDVVQGERWEWQQTGKSADVSARWPCFPIWPKLRAELYYAWGTLWKPSKSYSLQLLITESISTEIKTSLLLLLLGRGCLFSCSNFKTWKTFLLSTVRQMFWQLMFNN